MLRRLAKRLLSPVYSTITAQFRDVSYRQESASVLLGQMMAESVRRKSEPARLGEVEFRVFSQFGEDGIIQYLLSRVPVLEPTFVEIGVEDYLEANTRFLLVANKWSGLVIEANSAQVEAIGRSELSWRCSLSAVAAFVSRENIDDLLRESRIGNDIGLLSIDIDGNDYWVWKGITITRPRIVVCEFNRLFGCEMKVTIPYDPTFVAHLAHPSRLYYGASLPALGALAAEKGYELVGVTSEGVNAFFVRSDVLAGLTRRTPRECFASITSAAPRSAGAAASGLDMIGHLPVVDVISGVTSSIRELADRMAP